MNARILLFALAISIATTSAAEPTASPLDTAAESGNRARTLHEQAPGQFFERTETREPIDFDHIDQALLAAAVFHETNRRRTDHDLPSLAYQPALREAARVQARAMVRKGEVTHLQSDEVLRAPHDRLKHLGLDGRFAAENVAMVFGIRYESGEQVYSREVDGVRIFSREPDGEPIPPHSYASFAKALLDAWMESPGHRKNILSAEPELLGTACLHDRSAMGMDRFFCAQAFYAPSPDQP